MNDYMKGGVSEPVQKEFEKSGQRNNSLDLFRYICALLVVAVHTNPVTEVNFYLGYFCSQILPRIAVPFFFCVSGYFYIKKLNNATKKREMIIIFKTTFLSYLKIYSFWSIVYLVCFYKRYFYEGVSVKGVVAGIILDFFIYGSYYHLWYFIGVFFSLNIVTLCYLIGAEKKLAYFSVVLYLTGVLGCAYYQIGNQVPLLSLLISSNYFTLIRRIVLMALPFFMMGYFLPKISDSKISIKVVLTAVLFVGEIIVVNMLGLNVNIIETIFLYIFLVYVMVWILHHPQSEKKRAGQICRYLAGFVYFSHPLFIIIITRIGIEKNTIVFMLSVIFSTAAGLILMKINNKTLNQFIS